MGGKRKQGDQPETPRGVSIRKWGTGQAIRIIFSYRGVQCRESNWEVNPFDQDEIKAILMGSHSDGTQRL